MISSIALPLLCFIGVIVGLSATDEWYENTGYNKYLLESVPGEVKAGKYFHYSLNYQGPLSLYLTSKTGDADFYVSTSVEKPTYDPDTYDVQSASCGIDVVHIPESFKRPVHISVYGHPAAETSVYILEVVHREEPFDSEINLEYYLSEKKNSSQSIYHHLFPSDKYSRGRRDNIFFFLNFIEPFLSSFLEI
ncbi:hypothetical protein M8J75_000141 [Diaphorina citri]|nr:hypothetical protein M8J75_000141 [Diaphorina citri]